MTKTKHRQPEVIYCHTFRATSITIYLKYGGTEEKAQAIAAHESPRTTKLYDRRNDAISLNEIEWIIIRECEKLIASGLSAALLIGFPGARHYHSSRK